MTVFQGQSQYLAEKLLNHTFRATSYTAPTSWYLALMTTNSTYTTSGTEFTSGSSPGYVRTSLPAFNAPSASANSSSIANSTDITCYTPSGDGQTAVEVAIFDQASGGNRLYSGPLTTSIAVKNGVPIVITASSNPLTLSLGGQQL